MKKPLPQPNLSYNEPVWIFPFSAMSIGDSFFIPTMQPAYMSYVIDTSAKKLGLRIKAFTRTEEEVLGVRAWRIG
jgi:hypothetical protein